MKSLAKLILAICLALALNLMGRISSCAQPSLVQPSSQPQSRIAESCARQLCGLPVAAQADVAATLGREEARYRVAATGLPRLRNPPQQVLRAEFRQDGIRVDAGGGQWRLAFQGWGYGDHLTKVRAAKPRRDGNRVEYHHGALVEWYVNGIAGLEQGFTIRARPLSGAGNPKLGAPHSSPLTIALAIRGNLTAVAGSTGRDVGRVKNLSLRDADGDTVLHYSGLNARDASGRELAAWMELDGQNLRLHVDDTGARYPVVIDPFIEAAKLTAPANDPDPTGEFGSSVSISSDGSTIVAGAPRAKIGSNVLQGAVYVFIHTSRGWSQTAKLTASDGVTRGQFGIAVSVNRHGSTIVVRSTGGNEPGTVYVFAKSESGWTQTSEFQGIGASSVAISGDGNTIAVGNASGMQQAGEVYIYTNGQGGWSRTGTVTGSDAIPFSWVGQSVSISDDGNTIVAGATAYQTSSGVGGAYVFTNTNNGWAQAAKLSASDGTSHDAFGSSVSVSRNGGIIVVGAPEAHNVAGAAYVFAATANSWPQTMILTSADTGLFGFSVAVNPDGNSIVASGGSKVVAFFNDGSRWNEVDKLKTSRAISSVNLNRDGGTLVFGVPQDPPVSYRYNNGQGDQNVPRGAAYVDYAANRP